MYVYGKLKFKWTGQYLSISYRTDIMLKIISARREKVKLEAMKLTIWPVRIYQANAHITEVEGTRT